MVYRVCGLSSTEREVDGMDISAGGAIVRGQLGGASKMTRMESVFEFCWCLKSRQVFEESGSV